ncbi:MAG TPA: hypothetical protein VFI22_07445, partial [Thermomicrobiales bacterium]|nr:hypothetical protein [Thermomicrobiales bacterium]
MTTSQRSLALLSGASISALGLAMPAYGAVVTNPGPAPHVIVSATSITDTLVICAIDDDPDAVDCLYGVSNTGGTGLQTATVNAPANGQVQQVLTATGPGSTVNGTISNNGDAEIQALVTAGAAAGAANAEAFIEDAVQQIGKAPGNVILGFTNSATLLIDAVATATANIALARATELNGIFQRADSTGTGDAVVAATNSGTLTVVATANANGGATGRALAGLANGIYQIADAPGDLGSAAIDNEGSIVFGAAAFASGDDAYALAYATGLRQDVVALTGNAAITNAGTLVVSGDATASGATTASAYAYATGVQQEFGLLAEKGDAAVLNSGTMTVTANA